MGAVGLHHRSVSAAAGASLRGRVSGVSLLQSHCRENTRLAHFTLAPFARFNRLLLSIWDAKKELYVLHLPAIFECV